MVELRTGAELDAMREAGRITARALAAVQAHARPGIRLGELDEVARAVVTEAGAAPLGHGSKRVPRPFPGAVRTSVNDVIVHGAPGPARLVDGDLLSVEGGARVDGWCGHAAVTFPVGACGEQDRLLVSVTAGALADGISAARPGARLGDVSAAIGVVGRGAGYGIPGPLGGHGVGRDVSEEPFVPNEGRPGRGLPLRPGLVLSIEPVFLAGGRDDINTDENSWTVRTGDGGRAAHVGHTVAVTTDGPSVLTAP